MRRVLLESSGWFVIGALVAALLSLPRCSGLRERGGRSGSEEREGGSEPRQLAKSGHDEDGIDVWREATAPRSPSRFTRLG